MSKNITHSPNAPERPICIDLFSGAGGLSLGFEQAGFDVAVAVELDPVHAAVHQYNFPECAVLPRSVAMVTGSEIRAAAHLQPKQPIAVVMGGAPCQGFSLMGKRALDDPRNGLVKEFLRLVEELQPSYFLFENVKGLTQGQHRQFLTEIVEEIAAIGYRLLLPWQVLNARDYGVPQSRERLFLVGAKQGVPLPSYPLPITSAPTCADALGDLPNAEAFEDLLKSGEVTVRYKSAPQNAYASEMRCMSAADWHYGYRRHWKRSLLTNSIRTNHSAKSRRRFRRTPPGTREPVSRFHRLSAEGVSITLRAGTDATRGAFTSPRPIHYGYARCVTVREMARLHSFPDWFRLHNTKWHGAREIGNSVPPLLARAIAGELIKALRC